MEKNTKVYFSDESTWYDNESAYKLISTETKVCGGNTCYKGFYTVKDTCKCCIDCETFNRKSDQECAETKFDCGQCKEGYKMIGQKKYQQCVAEQLNPLQTGSPTLPPTVPPTVPPTKTTPGRMASSAGNRFVHYPTPEPKQPSPPDDENNFPTWAILIIITISAVPIIIGSIVYYKKKTLVSTEVPSKASANQDNDHRPDTVVTIDTREAEEDDENHEHVNNINEETARQIEAYVERCSSAPAEHNVAVNTHVKSSPINPGEANEHRTYTYNDSENQSEVSAQSNIVPEQSTDKDPVTSTQGSDCQSTPGTSGSKNLAYSLSRSASDNATEEGLFINQCKDCACNNPEFIPKKTRLEERKSNESDKYQKPTEGELMDTEEVCFTQGKLNLQFCVEISAEHCTSKQ